MLLSASILASASEIKKGTPLFDIKLQKNITLGTLDWYPYIGENVKDNGYVYQIIKAAFKRVGYKVTIKFYPWARVIKKARDGQIDGYFPEYFNEKLKKDFKFSSSYPGGKISLLKRKDTKIISIFNNNKYNFAKLKPYTIGIVRGYTNSKAFDDEKHLKKVVLNDDISILKMLYHKRIQLGIMDTNVARYLIQVKLKKTLPNADSLIESISPELEYKLLFTCFSKKSKNYERNIKDFNRGLALIKKDGTLNEILKQHHFTNGIWKGSALDRRI